MKFLLYTFILLLLSTLLGLEIAHHTGYVLISYEHWMIQTHLWVAAFLLIVSFIAFYGLFRILVLTFKFPRQFKRWKKNYALIKSYRLLKRGLYESFQGNWKKAERFFNISAKCADNMPINYLSAARAANKQHAYHRRDVYLQKAHQQTNSIDISMTLMQAQLQIESHQWEQALATLEHLRLHYPNHPQVSILLKEVYLHLNDYKNLLKLLPTLNTHKIINSFDLEILEHKVYSNVISDSANSDELHRTWNSLSPRLRKDIILKKKYIRCLIRNREHKLATHIIEKYLKKYWDPECVILYSENESDNLNKQLTTAQSWLKKYPNEPELFYCLGKLNIRRKLMGEAVHYLKKSIELNPSFLAYKALGEVYISLGENEQALMCFNKSLSLCSKG